LSPQYHSVASLLTHRICSVWFCCITSIHSWTLALAVAGDTQVAPFSKSFVTAALTVDPAAAATRTAAAAASAAAAAAAAAAADSNPEARHSIHTLQKLSEPLSVLLILSFRPLLRYKGLFVKMPPDYSVSHLHLLARHVLAIFTFTKLFTLVLTYLYATSLLLLLQSAAILQASCSILHTV
jgi:hypothetical protein